jgi:hypothetical protein
MVDVRKLARVQYRLTDALIYKEPAKLIPSVNELITNCLIPGIFLFPGYFSPVVDEAVSLKLNEPGLRVIEEPAPWQRRGPRDKTEGRLILRRQRRLLLKLRELGFDPIPVYPDVINL